MSEYLEDLAAFPLATDADSGKRVLTRAHPLAIARRLTSCDTAYLEPVLRRSIPLATLDADLLRACRSAGVSVLDPIAAMR